MSTILCPACKCRREPAIVNGRALNRCEKCRTRNNAYLKRRYAADRERFAAEARARAQASPRANIRTSLHNAKKRGQEVAITVDDVMALWAAQGGRCALSGIEMTWAKGKTLPTSISMDRIDQTKGYVSGNVRLLCTAVNAFRGIMTDDETIAMARSIVILADASRLMEAA